jgi:hypothetical protein
MSRRVGSASAENTLDSASAGTPAPFVVVNRLVERNVRPPVQVVNLLFEKVRRRPSRSSNAP